jgi:hypothetical protein
MVVTRDDALATLEEGHRLTVDLIARLTDDQLSRPATIGGGDWSAKDLLGHIASWEEYALRALDEWRRGERPWVEDVFRTPDEVDRVNAEAVVAKAAMSDGEVREAAEASFRALADSLRSMSDDEWRRKAPYETKQRQRLGNLLGSITGAPKGPFAHAFAHLPDLDAYVASLATKP